MRTTSSAKGTGTKWWAIKIGEMVEIRATTSLDPLKVIKSKITRSDPIHPVMEMITFVGGKVMGTVKYSDYWTVIQVSLRKGVPHPLTESERTLILKLVKKQSI